MNVRALFPTLSTCILLAAPALAGVPASIEAAKETPATTDAPPPAAETVAVPATRPGSFGAPITLKKAVPIAKLEKKPERFAGKTLRLEGVVASVCQGRGCWIEVEGPNGVTFLAKSLDESVLVPKDCKGQKVVVQGVVTRLTAKGHDHAAHGEAEAHECPAPSWVLATSGVELKPRAER
jgi:hypothetical protein